MIQGFLVDRTDTAGLSPIVTNRGAVESVRVVAREEYYELTTDLAGADEDDILVGVIDHVLTVAAKTVSESCRDIGGFLLVDYHEGTIEQSFALPFDADEQDMGVRFEAGTLTVTIGRRVTAKPLDLSSWRSAHAHC